MATPTPKGEKILWAFAQNFNPEEGADSEKDLSVSGYSLINNTYKIIYKDGRIGVQRVKFASFLGKSEITYLDSPQESSPSTRSWIVRSLVVSDKGIAAKFVSSTLNHTSKRALVETYKQIGEISHERQREVLSGLGFIKRKELITELGVNECAEMLHELSLNTNPHAAKVISINNQKVKELYHFLVQSDPEKAIQVFEKLSDWDVEVQLLEKLSKDEKSYVLEHLSPETIAQILPKQEESQLDIFLQSSMPCTTKSPMDSDELNEDVVDDDKLDDNWDWQIIDADNEEDISDKPHVDHNEVALQDMVSTSNPKTSHSKPAVSGQPLKVQVETPEKPEVSIQRANSILRACSVKIAAKLLLDLSDSDKKLAFNLLTQSARKTEIFQAMVSQAANVGEPSISSVSVLFCQLEATDKEHAKQLLRRVEHEQDYGVLFKEVRADKAAEILFGESPELVSEIIKHVYPKNVELVLEVSGLNPRTGLAKEGNKNNECLNKFKAVFVLLPEHLQIQLLSLLPEEQTIIVAADIEAKLIISLLLKVDPKIAAAIINQDAFKTKSLADFISENNSEARMSDVLQLVKISKLHEALIRVSSEIAKVCISQLKGEQYIEVLKQDLKTQECFLAKKFPSLFRRELGQFSVLEQATLVNAYFSVDDLRQDARLIYGLVISAKEVSHQAVFLLAMNPDCFCEAVVESKLSPEAITCIIKKVEEGEFESSNLAKKINLLPLDNRIKFFMVPTTKAQVKNYLSQMEPKAAAEVMFELLQADRETWATEFMNYEVEVLYPRLGAGVIISSAIKYCLMKRDVEFQLNTLIYFGKKCPAIGISVWGKLHNAPEGFSERLIRKPAFEIAPLIAAGIDKKVEGIANICSQLSTEELQELLGNLNKLNKVDQAAKLTFAISQLKDGKQKIVDLPTALIVSMLKAIVPEENKNHFLTFLSRENSEKLLNCWAAIPTRELAEFVKNCDEQNLSFICQALPEGELIETIKAILKSNVEKCYQAINVVNPVVIVSVFNQLSRQEQLRALPKIIAQQIEQSTYLLQTLDDDKLLSLLNDLEKEYIELVVLYMINNTPIKLKNLSHNPSSYPIIQSVSDQIFVSELAVFDVPVVKKILNSMLNRDLVRITKSCAEHDGVVILQNSNDWVRKEILEDLVNNEERVTLSHLLKTISQDELAALFMLYPEFNNLNMTGSICECAPSELIIPALNQADQQAYLSFSSLSACDVLQMKMAYEKSVEELGNNETIYDASHLIQEFNVLLLEQTKFTQEFIECIPATIKWQLLADNCDEEWCKEYLLTASEESIMNIHSKLIGDGKHHKAEQIMEEWVFIHREVTQIGEAFIQEPEVTSVFDQISQHLLSSDLASASTLFISQSFDSQVVVLNQLEAADCGSILLQMDFEEAKMLLIELAKISNSTQQDYIKINQILNVLENQELILAVWKQNMALISYIDPFTNVDTGPVINKLFAFDEGSSGEEEFGGFDDDDPALQQAIAASTATANGILQYAPVEVPEGFEFYAISDNGDCFFRAKLAIERRDRAWLKDKTKMDVHRILSTSKDIKKVTEAVESSLKNAVEVLQIDLNFLLRIAGEKGFERSVKGAAELICKKCIRHDEFQIYSNQGLEQAIEGSELQVEEQESKQTLFYYLPDMIGNIMVEKFNIASHQVDDVTPYICKLSAGHIDLIAPIGFFDRT
ncbi:hypothetical protein D5R81_06815 [Parashewanella spongiae]|uniref:Uncharacterized protein n=1 Tax=Parashewanella spongiae TaxID=342950 RepID=A0A3A6TUZ1_9GAMM|nr:hypothetical protein [Parashewanella spongiae]MCL1077718.1 hypothetical protein [Parashewanella spongiae]RJY18084.1 hypothetical protein D5R81_06815 [Parashewanella spongiae]